MIRSPCNNHHLSKHLEASRILDRLLLNGSASIRPQRVFLLLAVSVPVFVVLALVPVFLNYRLDTCVRSIDGDRMAANVLAAHFFRSLEAHFVISEGHKSEAFRFRRALISNYTRFGDTILCEGLGK